MAKPIVRLTTIATRLTKEKQANNAHKRAK